MTGPLGWIRRRSQTLDLLVRLLSHLPAQRRRTLLRLLPFSVLPGLTDLALVAVGARMAGARGWPEALTPWACPNSEMN